MHAPNNNRKYWEENIEGFAGFYDRGSEEKIDGPVWLRWGYRTFLFPIEKHFMHKRLRLVCQFINDYVKEGSRVADIGCGSGVFTRMMAEKGAFVFALDYAESALALARQCLEGARAESIEWRHADVSRQPIPEVDSAMAIGVLPYIPKSRRFFENVLPYTRRIFFNFVDEKHFLNRLRKTVPVLDVRHLSFHSLPSLEEQMAEWNFFIKSQEPLATGFVVHAQKKESSEG